MKISDKISSSGQSRPFFTLEFFPPRTDQVCSLFPVFKQTHGLQGFDNLLSRISRLALLDPLAVSVTWGAGGSTKDKSIELASLTQNNHNLTTLLHLTCTNAELGQVDATLQVCVSWPLSSTLPLMSSHSGGATMWHPEHSCSPRR